MSRGRDHHNYKDGAYAGGRWREYRYGSKRRAKPAPIFRGEKRAHQVQQVMDQMRHWRLSPFEFEGSTVAAIRSGLCLDGYAWSRSDMEARSLVSEALNRLGARRPTWEQAQREYTVARENCSWCMMPIDDDLLRGTRPSRFCSEECARAALQHRDFEMRSREDQVWQNVIDSIRKTKVKARRCEQCGKTFRPLSWIGDGRYCSAECGFEARRKIEERPCQNCGQMFRPKKVTNGDRAVGLFCSKACRYAYERPARECFVCGAEFRPRSSYAFFCSPTCNKRAYKIRIGVVKSISPPVLDYLLRRQGLRITSGVRLAA